MWQTAIPYNQVHWTRKLRWNAYDALRAAIECGKVSPITEDTLCADCGAQAKLYDHRDYYKPLDVEPVCTACNNRRGEGFPPVQGEPLYSNGLPDFRGTKHWDGLALIETHDLPDVSGAAIKPSETGAKWADFTKPALSDRILWAFDDTNKYVHGISRGVYRSDFFKKHDPYFSEYA